MRRIVFLACLLLMPVFRAYGAVMIGGIAYNLDSSNKTAEVTKKSSDKYSGSVVIPSQITRSGFVYSVTGIGDNAFSGCSSLASITIPEGVTSIGIAAFLGCSGLISITIPESVTSIKSSAFKNCSGLTSITISSSVTSISQQAFLGCSGLTSITIPEGVTSIEVSAFSGCSGLTSITVEEGNAVYDSRDNCNAIIETGTNTLIAGSKNTVIPESVASIGSSAFSGRSGLTSITIPEGVTSIGSSAFFDCSGLTSITIPNSVISIGVSAFSGCSGLTSITIPEGVASIDEYVFSGCSSLSFIAIPNVTSIKKSAFRGCGSLDSVFINSNTIVSTTYDSSNNLKSIFGTQVKEYVLGDCITRIGDYAFSGCSNLTSINIPEGVKSIGIYVFDGCSSLYNVYINSNRIVSATHDYDYTFETIFGTQVKKYMLGEGITKIGDYTFYSCSGLTSVTIPESVTEIGHHAFSGCSGLTSINIPESVTSIGSSAFSGCSGLTSINIPESVTSIGVSAFIDTNIDTVFINSNAIVSKNYDLIETDYSKGFYYIFGSGVNNYVLGNSVTSIGSSAFKFCSGLTSITIPSSVTSIGVNAFYGCSNLTSITIPEGVTSIGSSAFSGCSGLTSINIPSSVTSIGDDVFNTSIDTVFINSNAIVSKNYNVVYISYTHDYFSYGFYSIFGPDVKNYVLGDSVTCIGNNVFYECTGLTSITIFNSSVTSIGANAFYRCKKNLVLKIVVTDFAAFCNNNGVSNFIALGKPYKLIDADGNEIKEVVIPEGVTSIGVCAFYNCSILTSIIIPNSVTSVGYDAFYGTAWFNNQPDGLVYAGSVAYKYKGEMPYGTNIVLKKGTSSIGNGAFSGCSGLTSITIPEGVTSIEVSAFSGCSGLTSINIPESVTSIGSSAFSGCSGLTSVTIGSGVTSIGSSAFYNCSGLSSITIPNSVTSIGGSAFYGCSGLSSITIPESVTSIGARAFSGCASLEKFSFGSQVSIIGEEAFSDCISLTEIKSFAIVPPICGNQALDDINKWDCTLSVPESSIKDYQTAEQWKDFFFIVKNEDYVDAVYQVKDRIVDVKIENETIIVSGMNAGDMVSVYQMNGNLISTKTAINGTAQISITDIAKGTQLIIRIGKNTRKMMIM